MTNIEHIEIDAILDNWDIRVSIKEKWKKYMYLAWYADKINASKE